MYTENSGKDIVLFCKAFSSNQLARFAPKLYVNLTHQTGRGSGEESVSQVVDYYFECFNDYCKYIGIKDESIESYFNEKVILEYGPGDILGVALLFIAHGAKTVHCVDRFPLTKMSKKNIDIYNHILSRLGDKDRERAQRAFKEEGNPASGFSEKHTNYKVTKNGLSGENNYYDLIISRAVLEHVNNLEETMLDIKYSLKDTGVSLHQVDLKSHGLDRYVDFDFLTWPRFIYNLMYSHKGYPNRLRVNRYKELAEKSNLSIKELITIDRLEMDKINLIYNKLDDEFRDVSPEELSCLGFWLVLD